jgi:hypothetical protein
MPLDLRSYDDDTLKLVGVDIPITVRVEELESLT